MNKQGQNYSAIIIIALVLGLLVYLGIVYGYIGHKTLAEHGQPVEMGEDGQGMKMGFYEKDAEGNWVPVEIPDWFKIAETTGVVGAIVKHSPAPSCSIASDCAGYTSGGNIDCYQGNCVLKNIDGIDMVVSVTNPSVSSDVNFENVYISSASPTGLANVLSMGAVNSKDLPLDGTISWSSSIMDIYVEGWIDTTQTFSITIDGTNSITQNVESSSDAIILQFGSDPTGTFIVSIESAVPN